MENFDQPCKVLGHEGNRVEIVSQRPGSELAKARFDTV